MARTTKLELNVMLDVVGAHVQVGDDDGGDDDARIPSRSNVGC